MTDGSTADRPRDRNSRNTRLLEVEVKTSRDHKGAGAQMLLLLLVLRSSLMSVVPLLATAVSSVYDVTSDERVIAASLVACNGLLVWELL